MKKEDSFIQFAQDLAKMSGGELSIAFISSQVVVIVFALVDCWITKISMMQFLSSFPQKLFSGGPLGFFATFCFEIFFLALFSVAGTMKFLGRFQEHQ